MTDREYYPDGLTRAIIDVLVCEVAASVVPERRVPSSFDDREADLRRERRRSNRAAARMVRALALSTPGALREVA